MTDTILPSNASALERHVDTLAHNRLAALPIGINALWSVDVCPSEFLPFLAAALSVDVWHNSWSEARKRQVIADSVFVHRHKGTRVALERAIASLDMGIEIAEWFEYGGDPYHFRADVYVSQEGLSADGLEAILSVIDRSKNLRSVLETLRIFLAASLTRYRAMSVRTGQIMRILPYRPNLPVQAGTNHQAIAVRHTHKIRIGAAA